MSMQSYYLYAAVLAVKLLALVPAAHFVCNPDKLQRANLNDLKHLTPFWLVAALFMTTEPDKDLALNLMRVFVVARFIAAAGHVTRLPKHLLKAVFFISFAITVYMAGYVVYQYKDSV